MRRIAFKHARAPRWQRHGAEWHLFRNGLPVARLFPIDQGWLSDLHHEHDNGLPHEYFPTLALGKACLIRWCVWRDSYHAFYQYMTRGLGDEA